MDYYAIVDMAGVFPGAKNLDEYWNNIINAKVIDGKSLRENWKKDFDKYAEKYEIDDIYNDTGFCFPDDLELPSVVEGKRQIEVAKYISNQLKPNLRPESERVGLVLGTSWSDLDYFENDVDCIFKKSERKKVFTPGNQIKQIAEYLNISGPVFSVDTACASSLYAIDDGIGLLKNRIVDSVVVMGLSAGHPYYLYQGFSKLRAFSRDGKILPFSKDSSGLILGEGAGAIVIERLKDALDRKHNVLAVIRSMGISSNGSERSVFAPGYEGQIEALKRTYNGIEDLDLSYIETHGTATKLGDATEIKAIKDFMMSRHFGTHIPIGSVKSLIGHSLAAAGIASIIKAVLMIQNRSIPPYIEVSEIEELNDNIVYLPSEVEHISEDKKINIAVSAFGFGGANAHVLLSSPDEDCYSQYETLSETNSKSEIINILSEPIAVLNYVSAKDLPQEEFFTDNPRNRFSYIKDKKYSEIENMKGSFFADSMTIDAYGLRMGPNALKAIDPFQALTIHLSNKLIKGFSVDSKNTGIVTCGNMGGMMALRQYRKSFVELNKDEFLYDYTEGFLGSISSEVTYDEIASTISSLLSGFQSRNLDIRGFHQTISGDENTFVQTLLLLPYWLSNRCDSLILGAGSIIKSIVDVNEIQESKKQINEDISLLFVSLLSHINDFEKKNSVCAIIKAIVVGSATEEEICKCAQMDINDIDCYEKIEIDGDEDYLGESTGILSIIEKIKNKKNREICIQYIYGGNTICSVFVENKNESRFILEKNEIPVNIKFGLSSTDLPDTSFIDDTLNRRVYLDNSMNSFDVKRVIQTTDSLTQIVLNAIEQNKKILSVKNYDLDIYESLYDLYRNKKNIVLDNNYIKRCGDKLVTKLIVDENHNYYYDHDLDHIPGFLIIAGILQTIKIDNINCDYYVEHLKICYKAFGEKDDFSFINVNKEKEDDKRVKYSVSVRQKGKEIAFADISIRRTNNEDVYVSVEKNVNEQTVNKIYTHKKYDNNVIITDIDTDEEGNYLCNSVKTEEDYALLDGSEDTYNILYYLELTRQFLTQALHKIRQVEMHSKQILSELDIKIDMPIRNDSRITVKYYSSDNQRMDDLKGQVKIRYLCDEREIGKASYTAVLLDEKTYDMLRKNCS